MAVTQEQKTVSDGRGRPEQVIFPALASGKLDSVPEFGEGDGQYDYTAHKALKKDSFTTPDLWHDWKAELLDVRSEVYRKKLADFEADAKEHRHFAQTYRDTGSFPKSKRAVTKKALDGLAAIQELREMLGDGAVDLDGTDLAGLVEKLESLK